MEATAVKNHYQSLIKLFAEFYKYPDEAFMEEFKNGTIEDEINTMSSIYSSAFDEEINLQHFIDQEHNLQKQFMKAFSGISKPFTPPVESLYKQWSADTASAKPLASKKGYYMGDSALHMKHLLHHYQLDIPENFTMTPDHLVIELEFYAFLIEEDMDAAMTFRDEHLNWISDFEAALQQLNDIPFYQEVTKRLSQLLMVNPTDGFKREE
ncbi:TorD/DmsD family molecular chaperone [Salipaludibacillus daqingensis]|uniref:TorD/DmsD family molecular chaperone n=1 Tax=Salipaludibacillus daqingensis TaxID=3041001 RepID=UPI0024736635|nr:molecular chaperone TorD family protein [Salipaludibacillus daqingensis]